MVHTFMLNEEANHFRVINSSSHMECGTAKIVGMVNLSPVLQKKLSHIRVPGSGNLKQRYTCMYMHNSIQHFHIDKLN